MSGLQQPGAAAAAKALPPMIPFGVGEDRHFELALELQQRPTPFESMGVVDDDLIFAAAWYSAQGVELREVRRRTGRWLQQLRGGPQNVAHHSPSPNLPATGYPVGYEGAPHRLDWTHHVAHWLAGHYLCG